MLDGVLVVDKPAGPTSHDVVDHVRRSLRQRRVFDEMYACYRARRLGEPEDIAHAVLFFASDYAGWITGQVLPVSGTPFP